MGRGRRLDERELDWYARYQRSSVAPGALIAETFRFLDTDVRADASLCPCSDARVRAILTTTRGGETVDISPTISPVRGSWSSLIGLRRFHWYGRADAIIEEVGRFLGEIRDEEASLSRQLATVMFTDIVDSTVRAVELGDAKWRELLSRHDDVVNERCWPLPWDAREAHRRRVLRDFDGPARGVKCAQAIARHARRSGWRSGLACIPGRSSDGGDDLIGVAVHIGARVGHSPALRGARVPDREGPRRRLRPRLRRRR